MKHTIGVVGLGLIGGSMAKTIRVATDAAVYGYDCDAKIVKKAIGQDVLEGELNSESICKCDILLIALYPQAVVSFMKMHLENIQPKTLVVDCTGIKGMIVDSLSALCSEHDIWFVGGHPMAGIEKAGYDNSFYGLFKNATMILCKDIYTNEEALQKAEEFFLSLEFGSIRKTTASEHDKVIAYTSQMAHVVSSAYIKSNTLFERYGFSAGSFKDLTRVAKLSEDMWTELFFDNREHLLNELNEFIEHISQYKDALENTDTQKMRELLKEGRILKEKDEQLESEWKKGVLQNE